MAAFAPELPSESQDLLVMVGSQLFLDVVVFKVDAAFLLAPLLVLLVQPSSDLLLQCSQFSCLLGA